MLGIGGWNSVVVPSLILEGIEVYALLINQLEPPLSPSVLVDGTVLLVLMSHDHSKKYVQYLFFATHQEHRDAVRNRFAARLRVAAEEQKPT